MPRWRNCLNLLVTFLVSGFWHGSSLTYILWGGIHGVLQVIETFVYPKKRKGEEVRRRKHWWQLPLTFTLLCFTWIFFRANSIQDAIWIISRLFWDASNPGSYLQTAIVCLGISPIAMLGMALSVLTLAVYDFASLKHDVIAAFSRQKFFIRWPVYVLFLVVIALFAPKDVATEFIYFQF